MESASAFLTCSATGDTWKPISIRSASCSRSRIPNCRSTAKRAAKPARIYCGTIGVEFMHIPDPERRRWIQERLEGEPAPSTRTRILDQLIRAELFEQMLQQRYLGTKRFSLEGSHRADSAARRDSRRRGRARRVRAGHGHEPSRPPERHGAHRGSATAEEVFAGFEDVDPRSVLGGGDVKYHMGATGEYDTQAAARCTSTWSRTRAISKRSTRSPSAARAPSRTAPGTGGAREMSAPRWSTATPRSPARASLAETLNLADLAATPSAARSTSSSTT